MARRTIQDWVVRPMLRSIRGVAEVNSIGGHVKEYQVLVDPNRLRHYDLTLAAVDRALASNNANASGNILPLHSEQYLIRGVGLIRSLDDIRNIVLKESEGRAGITCATWPRCSSAARCAWGQASRMATPSR